MAPRPRTCVYVDGFNLYYRALRKTTNRWLDLAKLCQLSLPKNDVVAIKYFTAAVRPTPFKPGLASRQQSYLRALRTCPYTSIILGHYIEKAVWLPLKAAYDQGVMDKRQVVRHEEKGSDVNLAAHLLVDASRRTYEVGVVITNDSDLVEPIRLANAELGVPVGLLSPIFDGTRADGKRVFPHASLVKAAAFTKQLRKGPLAASQFPTRMIDADGDFECPKEWL